MVALMEITRGEFERELRVGSELARRAGEAALAYYGKPLRVEHKEEFDEPVTQADRAVNELIVRALRESFPADGILAEESVDAEARLARGHGRLRRADRPGRGGRERARRRLRARDRRDVLGRARARRVGRAARRDRG